MMHSDPQYTIEIARDVDAVRSLRGVWQSRVLDPNADIDFFLTVVESRSEVLRPHVIALKRDGTTRCLLVGRIEKKALELSLGYKHVTLFPALFLTLIHGGLLGDASEENVSALAGSIAKSLQKREADVALFHAVDGESAFHRVASKMGGLLARDYFPETIRRWNVHLPATYEEAYRRLSTNTRHNLRRYSKRLCETFGEQMTVRSFRDPSDLEWILPDTEAVASRSYHRGLGVGFVDNEETRRLMNLAANQGWLRAHVLYIAGKPVAFWNGLLYGRTFFTWTTAYDPNFSEFRPGMFLLQRMFEDLCREKNADEVDFGFGDAQYKGDWCDHERLQFSYLLFGPSVKGVTLNMLRTPLVGVSRLARRMVARTGALQEIKRGWRSRLAKRGKEAPSIKKPITAAVSQPVTPPSGK